MDIKLTAAQEKLIEALKANPGTDAQEHLNHIHNQAIADEMIDRLLKFGILQLNPETGLRELAPAYMVTATANVDVDAVEEESDIIPNVEFGDTVTEKNEERQNIKAAGNSESAQSERIRNVANQGKLGRDGSSNWLGRKVGTRSNKPAEKGKAPKHLPRKG